MHTIWLYQHYCNSHVLRQHNLSKHGLLKWVMCQVSSHQFFFYSLLRVSLNWQCRLIVLCVMQSRRTNIFFPFTCRRPRLKLKPSPSPSRGPRSTHPSSLHVSATWCGQRWATASTFTVIGRGPDSTSAPWTPGHLQTVPGSSLKTDS